MTLNELVSRVRSYTRDTTATLFSLSDVQDFINEGVDKLKQIKGLEEMTYLTNDNDIPKLLPPQYHYCLSVYGACRCFSQDEQHYLSQTFADEFNGLFELIELGIKEGTILIQKTDGTLADTSVDFDGVVDVYFKKV